MRSLALAAVISVLTLAVPSTAQQSVGTIAGVVKDSAGAAIPGATVQITARGIAPITQVSDSSGAFTFERVPTADYEITSPSLGSSGSPRASASNKTRPLGSTSCCKWAA